MKAHDKLQSDCFLWFWNTFPEHRYLMHANIGNLTTQISGTAGAIKMGQLKSIGLVKGILDLEFYYKGVLYVFDIKVGSDKLSKEQLSFIAKVEEHGGVALEVRSLEEFQNFIKKVL
jgi:hypothetical protein